MSTPVGHALGVDFGTSHTVAVIRWPDGRARPLLIDGSPLLPSAVYAEPDGDLVVGRDAVHSARLDPARFEPNPKRRIDDGTVLLGDREIAVRDLASAVFSRVAEEFRRTAGDVTPTVTLTCPATWGATRRTVLTEAAARAGLAGARLVAEPVAAATYFAKVLGRDVPIGSVVVVHDFGAGTFDASVVARRSDGFEVLAVDGCDDLGGIDIDATLVEHLRASYSARDQAAWERLSAPTTVEDRRAKRQLWDDVRVAKERLSRTQRADLVLPLLDLEVHLTRDELEALARPLLERTIRVTEGVMRWAGLAEGSVAGVFLVGGSSRIPLLGTLLHRALGEAPVVIEQPELVVAEGSVLADEVLLGSAPAAPRPTAELPSVGGPSGSAAAASGSAASGAAASGAGSAGSGAAASGAGSAYQPGGASAPVPAAAVGAGTATPAKPPVESEPPGGDQSSSPQAPGGPASGARAPGGPATGAQAPVAPVGAPGGSTPPVVPAVPISSPPAGVVENGDAVRPGSTAPDAPGSPAGPTVGPAAGPTAGPTIGRVIIPGAQPPGRRRPAGSAPVNPTRQLPRVPSHPAATIPLPPRQEQGRPARPAPPPVVSSRPKSRPPVERPPVARRTADRRPAAPPRAPVARPPVDPRRGPSLVARFFRALFIMCFLAAVPLAAGFIAYQLARRGL